MADFKNSRRYKNLKRLSTEQLEELLRTAPFLSDGQETSEYYDEIEEVILQRETETPTGRLSDLDSSWKEFQQQYAAQEGQGLRLYPDEDESKEATSSVSTQKPIIKNIFRRVILIAATIAVVFACMIAAQATGVDVFGTLARWTEETFHFNSIGGITAGETTAPLVENETHLAIQAEVEKMDIDISVVPTWFPEGYELEEIRLPHSDITAWQDIDCCFRNQDGQTFFLTIAKYEENCEINNIVFEKDGQTVSQYISNDKLFYLMSNNSRKRGVWSNGYIVLSIDGSLSEETIKNIIDSIGG